MNSNFVTPRSILGVPVELSMTAIQQRHGDLMNEVNEGARRVRAFFRSIGIDAATLGKFRVCLAQKTSAFPHVGYAVPYTDGIEVKAVRTRNLMHGSDHACRLVGSVARPFNFDGIRDAQQVVVCDTEVDAMSLHQAGVAGVTVYARGFDDALRSATRSAKSVVLWLSRDERAAVNLFGAARCRAVCLDALPPERLEGARQCMAARNAEDVSPNDCINAGMDAADVRALIDNATAVGTSGIVGANAFNADLLEMIVNRGQDVLGTPTGLSSLDGIIRGLRDEFIMVTGHTGDGKSTFMHWLLEQQAIKGTPILIGSFENGPRAVVMDMFQRHYGEPITNVKTDAQAEHAVRAVGELGSWPVYILNHKGPIGMQTLVEQITYARQHLGVKHVLLDHLRFIKPRERNRDQFEGASQTLMEFSALPQALGCSITMVAHPKHGVERDTVPTGDSIFGGGDAKQLCDTGISVYRDPEPNYRSKEPRRFKVRTPTGKQEVELAANETLITVWKSRSKAAQRGQAVVQFDRPSLRFSDRPIPVDSSVPAENEDTAPPLFDVETYV